MSLEGTSSALFLQFYIVHLGRMSLFDMTDFQKVVCQTP